MSNTTYAPGLGNAPYNNINLNPDGANYPGISEYNAQTDYLLQKAFFTEIYDNAPAQFTSLKLFFGGNFDKITDVNSDEFEYYEKSFGRSPVEAAAPVAAAPAAAGAHQTQTITVTAGSLARISQDLILIYEDGSKGVITNIAGNVITVNSHTGLGLPAVAAGESFAVQSTIIADGMDYYSNYSRLDTIKRYAFVQFFLRAQRWTTLTMQKQKNLNNTTYMKHDKAEKMKQLRIDMFNSWWNGQQGELTISNGYVAKSMGGIYPEMVAAGAAEVNTTTAGFKAAFEALAFGTNHKAEGGTMYCHGTQETLYNFSQAFKQQTLQYTPNDYVAKMDLKKVILGGINYVMVPCELWRESSCFEPSWARKMICLDPASITPVKVKGIPAVQMNQTDDQRKGSREDFIDWSCKAQLGKKHNNPLAGFIMQL